MPVRVNAALGDARSDAPPPVRFPARFPHSRQLSRSAARSTAQIGGLIVTCTQELPLRVLVGEVAEGLRRGDEGAVGGLSGRSAGP
eukprot:1195244-Prorocentrum_minimum.AAC.4